MYVCSVPRLQCVKITTQLLRNLARNIDSGGHHGIENCHTRWRGITKLRVVRRVSAATRGNGSDCSDASLIAGRLGWALFMPGVWDLPFPQIILKIRNGSPPFYGGDVLS